MGGFKLDRDPFKSRSLSDIFVIDLWADLRVLRSGVRNSSLILCKSLDDWLRVRSRLMIPGLFKTDLCRTLSFDSASVSPKKRKLFVGVGFVEGVSSSVLVKLLSLSSYTRDAMTFSFQDSANYIRYLFSFFA